MEVLSDKLIAGAGRLSRRFHDATAGTALAGAWHEANGASVGVRIFSEMLAWMAERGPEPRHKLVTLP